MPDNVKSKLDNDRNMKNSVHLINTALQQKTFFRYFEWHRGNFQQNVEQELKELEINQLVKRTVLDTQPLTVQYELTKHGYTLQTIISNLTDWGIVHRKKIVGK